MEASQDVDANGTQHLPPLNAGLRLLDEAQRERVVIKEEKLDEEDERKIAHAFIEKQKDEIATLKEEKAALQKTLEQKDEVIKTQAARIAELEAKTTPEPAAPDETRKRKLDELDDALTHPITEDDYKSNKIRIPRNSTARLLLPDDDAKIYIELLGVLCAVDWKTGNDKDRPRSGTLLFREPRLKSKGVPMEDVVGPPLVLCKEDYLNGYTLYKRANNTT